MFKISQVAKKTGLPISTLHYYEALGIISPKRSKQGYRLYDETDLEWIHFIFRIKATGMTLADIKKYSDLRLLGDKTILIV